MCSGKTGVKECTCGNEYRYWKALRTPYVAVNSLGIWERQRVPFIFRKAASAFLRFANSTNPYPSEYPVCLFLIIFALRTWGADFGCFCVYSWCVGRVNQGGGMEG